MLSDAIYNISKIFILVCDA